MPGTSAERDPPTLHAGRVLPQEPQAAFVVQASRLQGVGGNSEICVHLRNLRFFRGRAGGLASCIRAGDPASCILHPVSGWTGGWARYN